MLGTEGKEMNEEKWGEEYKIRKKQNEIAEEIKERGQIQVPDGCVTGEEFEKWLREKNINLTPKEIANDCQGILDMLNNDEE